MNFDVPQMEEERSAACGLTTQRSYCVCTRSHLKRPYYAFLGGGFTLSLRLTYLGVHVQGLLKVHHKGSSLFLQKTMWLKPLLSR